MEISKKIKIGGIIYNILKLKEKLWKHIIANFPKKRRYYVS
jgi:hypothetical protein